MKIEKLVDEHTEQVNYFKLLEKHIALTESLILAHAIPNGGLRNMKVAKKLKAEGVKSGVPDIFIPIPRGPNMGLYIEMKKVKQWTITENQKFWLNFLNEQGYYAVVCKGALDAYQLTMDYIDKGVCLPLPERYIIKKSKIGKKDGLSKQYQQIAIQKEYCE